LKRGITVVAVGVDAELWCTAGAAEFEELFPLPLADAFPGPKPRIIATATAGNKRFIKRASPIKPFYLLLVALSYPDFGHLAACQWQRR
jgi:hypothetical protein